MQALTNCDVYTGDRVLLDQAVVVRGDCIVDLVPMDAIPREADVHDLQGLSLTSGFIDLQVNGGGDVLFNDAPGRETIETMVRAHRRFGTTDLLPTFITGRDEDLVEAVEAVRACIEAGVPGVLGIHLEGPFLNPTKAGVHDASLMRRMTTSDLKLLPSLAKGPVLLTLAPEMVDEGVIAEAVRRGLKVSAGHSNATCEEMGAAFREGLDCGTHLFNAMRNIESREPGVVGSVLENDNVWCGIIVDGFHVHFGSVRVAWNANASGRTFLVTDAMPPVGGRKASFHIGEYEAAVVDGRCQTAEGVLAGSALDMASAVRNAVQRVGIPKDEAFRMASRYPARYVGVDDRLGSVAPGYQANLVIIDNELHPRGVMVAGKLEWLE